MGAVIGRSRECDIVLAIQRVAHARRDRPDGAGWTIADLGSTNGVR